MFRYYLPLLRRRFFLYVTSLLRCWFSIQWWDKSLSKAIPFEMMSLDEYFFFVAPFDWYFDSVRKSTIFFLSLSLEWLNETFNSHNSIRQAPKWKKIKSIWWLQTATFRQIAICHNTHQCHCIQILNEMTRILILSSFMSDLVSNGWIPYELNFR